jgi:hypothetical protein
MVSEQKNNEADQARLVLRLIRRSLFSVFLSLFLMFVFQDNGIFRESLPKAELFFRSLSGFFAGVGIGWRISR